MKQIATSILFFLIVGPVCAQQILSYSGPYETGHANYQYLENDQGQRVFQGNFSYADTLFIPGYDTARVEMTGSYANNRKNLAWAVTVKSSTLTETVIGQYKDGEKSGLWTNRISNLDNNTDIKLVQASFLKNRFRGGFSYSFTPDSAVGEYRSLAIKGKFDSEGKLDGEWTLDYVTKDSAAFKEVLAFQHGLLELRTVTNASDGSIVLEEKGESATAFFENMNRTDSSSMVGDKKLALRPAPIEHGILSAVLSAWVRLDQSQTGGSFDAALPTSVIAKGETPATKALLARQTTMNWWDTKRGKAAKAEQERLAKAYENKIAQADEQFENKTYSNAIRLYREALALKKGDSYPTDRIKEAEELIRIQKKKESLAKSIEAERQIFLENDKKMKDEAFFRGKKHLFAASTILFDDLRKSLLSNNRDTRTNLERKEMEALTIESLEAYLAEMRDVTDMQKRVMGLVITEDTKSIEKDLKKLETPAQIKERIKAGITE